MERFSWNYEYKPGTVAVTVHCRWAELGGHVELSNLLTLQRGKLRPRGEKAFVQITQPIRAEQGITAFFWVFLLMRRSVPCVIFQNKD